jgi:signal transduction histidine kinase/DNA-binding response OmpR family regulator
MSRSPSKWVFFVLAVGFLALPAAAFEPLGSELPLPAALQGKPIWTVETLASGQLAVGFEGGLAIGTPGGDWQLMASPNGQVVRAVSEAHGHLLAVGHGFAAFVNGETIQPIPNVVGEFQQVLAVATGWLVTGAGGALHITPSAQITNLLSENAPKSRGPVRVCEIGSSYLLSGFGMNPVEWSDGQLIASATYAAFSNQEIAYAEGMLFVTSQGLRNHINEPFAADEVNGMLLQGGIVGFITSELWVLVPTFQSGLIALDRNSGKLAWKSNKFGDIYYAKRTADGFLLGTSNGLFSVTNPAKVETLVLEGKAILGLQTTSAGEVAVVTSGGTLAPKGEGEINASVLWPLSADGVGVINPDFSFGNEKVRLQSRFVYGLAAAGDTAAIAQDQGLTFLARDGRTFFTPVPALPNSLATDGRNFLVGTSTQGVQVVAPDGTVTGTLGAGRATVREVRPGKVALLFWDGTILDSDASTLGLITWGNPRDAALVQGRLAVLVTRPDRDPVVGLIEGDTWQPLEIPGLAGIGAEKITATDEFLFAAGPRGVIRARLPLTRSVAPQPNWSWNTTTAGQEVRLGSSAQEHAGLRARIFDPAPAPATFLRVRKTDGAWETLLPGAEFLLPVGWGRTPVTLQAERNGLPTETTFTIVRPWPWWLRVWAWPLHAVALGVIVFGLVRWRTRTLQRRNRELEAHVNERTAQLRKASAVKEEFLASISHEIRNPLNGVVGICAMLSDLEVGPREKKLVRTLGGCADQLRSMLDDILDFSRLERGHVTLTTSDFDVSSLVEEAARAMDPELADCALMLPDQPAWLHGDSGKIRQIVCNLISNALKYGVPREAGVEVRVQPAGVGRSRLRLAVRNSGPTLAPEELSRLFDSFQRGANTGNIPGSGLGLAVCRRLAVAMGGSLTAASQDGTTEFALELVLANAQPPATTRGIPAPVSRALAIEDEDYNRIALGHVLQQLGYTVDWAADGATALHLARTHQYDLVLTDWRLPDTDGAELCRQLVQILPRPTPPIVAVTAYSTKEKVVEAQAAGMTGFITKPVTKDKLERVIRGLSEGLQPKRSLDTHTAALAKNPLASLGDLAPSGEQLAANIALKWQSVSTLGRLRDPRTASEAHSLLGLLRSTAEEAALEQIALLEEAAARQDWTAVDRLLPFAEEELGAARARLRT